MNYTSVKEVMAHPYEPMMKPIRFDYRPGKPDRAVAISSMPTRYTMHRTFVHLTPRSLMSTSTFNLSAAQSERSGVNDVYRAWQVACYPMAVAYLDLGY